MKIDFEEIKEKQDKLIIEMNKNGYKEIESYAFIEDEIEIKYNVKIEYIKKLKESSVTIPPEQQTLED